jgi:hypothetical protein
LLLQDERLRMMIIPVVRKKSVCVFLPVFMKNLHDDITYTLKKRDVISKNYLRLEGD